MTEHLARVIGALERHGCHPRRERGDQWRANCPGPRHSRGDLRPSLGVRGLPDKVLLNCFVCARAGKAEILKVLGLSPSDLFAPSSAPHRPPQRRRRRSTQTYPYEEIDGRLLAQKHRYEPKTFRWRSPNADGSSRWGKAEGVTLYRLPHLIDRRLVLVLEGEKAVGALTMLGFVATCPPSGSTTWNEAYTEGLWRAGAHVVVVLPDNDRPGREHAQRVVQACHGFRPTFLEFACEPKAPWSTWPCAEPEDDEVQPLRAKLLELEGLPYRGDVCDWLDAGHTAAELQVLIDTAPDLAQIERARLERKRRLDRERQRRHRERLRVAAI